ncbi:glycosyltransferase [Patescibacteria group bacterium]
MKIALVHDHLDQVGGAENVLKAFHEVFPDAPIFTLVYNSETTGDFGKEMDIRTSFIQRIPGAKKHFKAFLPIMPTAIESLNLMDYDVVLSDSSAFSKGVITRPETAHICYCHTPTRYLWHDTHDYTAEIPANRVLKKILPFMLTQLRSWDKDASQRVDYFIGNSKTVSERIWKYYRRKSDVIHPPVSFSEFKPLPRDEIGDYFLIGGRFRPYKRFDLAIKVFNQIGVPLKIFGSGEEENNLRRIAGPNIEFIGPIGTEEKQELYSRAFAFLHPAEEDFGITPLESMSFGRPVIAFGRGGALETVQPGVTGEFFHEQCEKSFLHVLRNFNHRRYDPNVIREHAMAFNEMRFKETIRNYVDEKWISHQKQYLHHKS